MGKRGPKSKYNDEIADRVFKLCLLGKTDDEIVKIIGISLRTLKYWKNKYPRLLHALKDGKAVADGMVANSLYNRALGYSHPDVDIKVINGEIVITDIIKHYPPDTTAAIFWLKNRQPELWRDVQKIEQINKNELVLEVRHVEANERLDIIRKAIDADFERIDEKSVN